LVLAIISLLPWLPHGASARVIGILFDDSGSMSPRIQLPTFGAQLLVSTLDGRNGQDRLFTVRLSQAIAAMGTAGNISDRDVPSGGVTADNVTQWVKQRRPHLPYTEEKIATEAQQQATLHDMATQWPHASVSTPYEPVEILLDRLTTEAQPGEDAVLVIMTDGDFNVPPDLVRVQASYNRYKDRMMAKHATLHVEFLLIAPNDPATIAAVQRQGVRAALLNTFNGTESGSSYEVTNLTQLIDALKNVIADVAGTDWKRQGRYISTSGNNLTINTPLSITRLVSVATTVEPQSVPQLQTQLANEVDARHLDSAMLAADVAPAIRGQKLHGRTEQMRFQPALEPGRHVLSYDRPVASNVFLLFETAATVGLRILQADGNEAPRNGDTYVLTKNVTYTLEASLSDVVNNAPVRVALNSLQGRADFAATIETPPTSRLVALTTDVAANRATVPLSFANLGGAAVRAQARLEGLVSSLSNPVAIQVVDAAVTFRTSIHAAEPCPTCASGELQSTIGAAQTQRSVATIELTPNAPTTGTATLDLSGMPGPLSLLRPDGTVIHDKDEVPIANGVPLRFDLQMTQPGKKIPERVPFAIKLVPKPPLMGEGKVEGTVVPNVPEAQLRYTSHSGGGRDTPFRLKGSDLLSNASPRNQLVLNFALENAIEQGNKTPAPDEFSVAWDNWMLSGVPRLEKYAVHLPPTTSWWCLCFLYWDTEHIATVRWRGPTGLQTAEASASFEVATTRPEMLWSCGRILAIALLLVWLLLALLNTVRARRFPRGSVSEVTEGRQLPRHLDLRHWNFTFLRSLLPWRAWLLRPPHERTSVEGLTFEATPGGAMVLLGQSSLDFLVIRLGQSAKEMLEINPKLQAIKIIWNDEIERSVGARMLIRLLKTLGEQPL
jgi:hypothetical protein